MQFAMGTGVMACAYWYYGLDHSTIPDRLTEPVSLGIVMAELNFGYQGTVY